MNKDIFVQLLGQRQFKAVRSILDVMNEVDIASLLSELDDKELALAFRLIPKDKAAEVFANMETSMQTYLVDMFSEKELKELLDDLYMDDTKYNFYSPINKERIKNIKLVLFTTIPTCYVIHEYRQSTMESTDYLQHLH